MLPDTEYGNFQTCRDLKATPTPTTPTTARTTSSTRYASERNTPPPPQDYAAESVFAPIFVKRRRHEYNYPKHQQDVLAWADEEGVSALALAVAHGQRECIDILLKGASPTFACGCRRDGNTVLHVAATTRGGVPVLKKLMSSSTYKGGPGEPFDPSWLEWRNRCVCCAFS